MSKKELTLSAARMETVWAIVVARAGVVELFSLRDEFAWALGHVANLERQLRETGMEVNVDGTAKWTARHDGGNVIISPPT